MKRHFLAGFMAFCVGVMSLSTVSCTKEIEQDIADLKGQVAELAQKIADLEARLTSEVNTLNTAIANLDKKIAVVGVENKDGNVVLTLSNGDKVTVAAPDANANNTNLVTTVTENGKTYWAVVGADGKAKSLGVEVGHPDVKLSFKVNPETKELLISYDGKEYEGTGVLVKNPDDYAHVVTAFEEGEDYVKLTIGEAVYTLPKYVEDNASLGLSREEFFVGYGTSKSVELTTEGIAEVYVMSKPDGWKTAIEGSVLTVTAPSKKLGELGACETEGEILIHATSAEGKCKVASLKVKTGIRFAITIDSSEKTIEFFNATSMLLPDYTGMGMETYEFGDAEIGIVEAEVFNSFDSFEAFLEAAQNYEVDYTSGYFSNIKNNNDIFNQYIEGEVEEERVSMSIETLGQSMWPAVEFEKGKHYVVFAVPQTDKVLLDEATYAVYEPIEISLTAESVLFNNITLNLECSGADGYYVGLTCATQIESMGMTLKDFMDLGYTGWGGPWKQFVNEGFVEAIGSPYVNGDVIDLSVLNYGYLTPSTKYYVWVFPYKANKPASEYVYETDFEPYTFEFTTAALIAGGVEPVIEKVNADFENLVFNITPGEGAVITYYNFYDPEQVNEMTDEELVQDVVANCYYPLTEAGEVKDNYLNAGTTRVLVAISVDAENKYGLATETWETLDYPYDENINVTLASLTFENDIYTATFNVSGASKLCLYYTYNSVYERFGKYLCQYGVAATNSTYLWADVVDGVATITFNKKTSSWYTYDYLMFSAYNVTNDAVSSLSEVQTVAIADYVTAE